MGSARWVKPNAPSPQTALPGNSKIVLSEAVLVRVIVIEVLDITRSITITRTSTMNSIGRQSPPNPQHSHN